MGLRRRDLQLPAVWHGLVAGWNNQSLVAERHILPSIAWRIASGPVGLHRAATFYGSLPELRQPPDVNSQPLVILWKIYSTICSSRFGPLEHLALGERFSLHTFDREEASRRAASCSHASVGNSSRTASERFGSHQESCRASVEDPVRQAY